MNVEILAPVGGREQLVAAVRSGADAVYLGTNAFNARRNAENFDDDYLGKVVEYCHGRGVKVYVTLNTLVKDSELPLVFDTIGTIAGSGADAVIVQDLAVAEMLRRHCPTMPLHASTQMVIHNSEGALMAKELGFKRVVLARELTFEEIGRISSVSGMEIEVFVHGALCMSVSGVCYLSSVLGERSGNRGLCAQPCRLDFRAGNRPYALSLKDMSYINHIDRLIEAGVCSFKIEGRMKRPEYVSAAVIACRKVLDGQSPDLDDLQAVFSRSGFTVGYISGKRGPDMFGHRTKEDVKASASVLGKLASNYRNELTSIPVSMCIKIKGNEPSLLSVSDGNIETTVTGDIPEKAKTRGADIEYVRRGLAKTGGTPFYLNELDAEMDESLIIPLKSLNAMRRQALNQLLELRSKTLPKKILGTYAPPCTAKRDSTPKIRIRFEKKSQIFDGAEEADRIYLPIGEINEELITELGERLTGELPRLIYPFKEDRLEKRLKELKLRGLKNISAGNPGAVRMALKLGFCVRGGFDLNILNSDSLLKYASMGLIDSHLSIEINLNDAARLAGSIRRGILGYGYLPLMMFRNCPAKNERGCGGCAGSAKLRDRTGAQFRVLCSGREYSSLLNSVPLYIGDKEVTGVDFVTLYFTVENADECKTIWEGYRNGSTYEGNFTRGLYYRKLR